MKNRDKSILDLVVKYHDPNKLDPEKAINKFRLESGIRPTRNKIYLRVGAIAASLLIGAFVLTRLIITPEAKWINIASTNDIIENYLPDSTKVLLYPNSSISYDANSYAEDKRQVYMSGQVYFDVQRDEKRPFEVWTKLTKVEVLGTRFQVDENSDNTEVFVHSGKLRFSSMDDSESVVLTKDMFAELSNSNNSVQIIEQTTPNPLAWAINEFIYNDTPISEVLEELSSFYDVKLSCKKSDKKLTSEFGTESLDEIINLIEGVLEIKIEKR